MQAKNYNSLTNKCKYIINLEGKCTYKFKIINYENEKDKLNIVNRPSVLHQRVDRQTYSYTPYCLTLA